MRQLNVNKKKWNEKKGGEEEEGWRIKKGKYKCVRDMRPNQTRWTCALAPYTGEEGERERARTMYAISLCGCGF